MQGKLLHIVGGGYNQIPIVKLAKKLGLKVLITDMYENPPCRALADFFEQVDTTDKELTLKIAKRHKIDAVLTDQTDVAVPTVAYVAEALGLKGIGYEKALKFTNKFLMRQYLQKNLGDFIPKFNYFESPKEALEYCSSLTNLNKYIVKPINSQGSKGVAQLGANYNQIISTAFNESRQRGVLIEEFLNGNEYSVEAYKDENGVHNLAVTKKYHFTTNDCIDERNTWLGDIDLELEKELFDLNTKVIEELGLPFGITHAEYKFNDGKPYLIEIAARGGGGSINSKIIPFLTGFEPSEALIHCLFNQPYSFEVKDYKKKYAVLKFFNLRPGKIKQLIIDKSMTDGLMEFNFNLNAGDSIKSVMDSRDRPGYFIVHGIDHDEVINHEKKIEESVQIEYE